tara:strand:+ start:885 stop:1118 length:234 start_codon:yes stop_codon:yes gene_type:complete
MKYKNKDGVELSFTNNNGDSLSMLVKEVVSEAIKLTKMYDKNCMTSHKMALKNVRKFLKENFDIKNEIQNRKQMELF